MMTGADARSAGTRTPNCSVGLLTAGVTHIAAPNSGTMTSALRLAVLMTQPFHSRGNDPPETPRKIIGHPELEIRQGGLAQPQDVPGRQALRRGLGEQRAQPFGPVSRPAGGRWPAGGVTLHHGARLPADPQ